MTRVSLLYGLGVTQGGLDFVDVDVSTDNPVFIDPAAIRAASGLWADEAKASLKSFFSELLAAIGANDRQRIQELIYPLTEPNETHLGNSKGKSKGRSLGSKVKADRLIASLAKSRAVQTGMLKDLDDSAMFVEGVGRDIVSDITTCVIRAHLIDYTQRMCLFWGIPMEQQVAGPVWDSGSLSWNKELAVDLPRADGDRLLLVPKGIVRLDMTVDLGKYYRGYLRPYYEAEVLEAPTVGLVRLLKDKTLRVVKGALDKLLGTTKDDVVERSQKYPQAFGRYKSSLNAADNPPVPDADLHAKLDTPRANVREMYERVKSIVPGDAGAPLYHRSVAELLTALFDVSLGNARIEEELHEGLKRVDVLYDNIAAEGFFRWVSLHYAAALVVVECKNYSRDVGNPEFDQIAMRFSPDRGKLGILVCRKIENRRRALARARAIATDDHGWVIVLDDDHLEAMVEQYEIHFADGQTGPVRYAELRSQFDRLIGVA